MVANARVSKGAKSGGEARADTGAAHGRELPREGRLGSTLAPVFKALDQLLAIAVDRQALRLGPASLLDPWRGMHLSVDDVRAIIAKAAHTALRGDAGPAELIAAHARKTPKLARVADWLGLTDLDLTIVMLALAPDVDLRYERIQVICRTT